MKALWGVGECRECYADQEFERTPLSCCREDVRAITPYLQRARSLLSCVNACTNQRAKGARCLRPVQLARLRGAIEEQGQFQDAL